VFSESHGELRITLSSVSFNKTSSGQETIPLFTIGLTLPTSTFDIVHSPRLSLQQYAELRKWYGPYTFIWPPPPSWSNATTTTVNQPHGAPLAQVSRVINCEQLCLSHPFSRIKWIRHWAVDRDPVLKSTPSAKLGKTAIPFNNQGSPFNNHCKAVFSTVSTHESFPGVFQNCRTATWVIFRWSRKYESEKEPT